MSEAFYDEHIAPELLRIAKLCKDNGMPFVASVEYASGEFGTTADVPEGHIAMRMVYSAARAQGNADALILALMRYAETHGHSSACLMQLGVPLNPANGS